MLRAIAILICAGWLAACGGSKSADDQSSTEPTAKTVASWPAKWCGDVHIPMSREEIHAVMGQPTEAFPDQDSWDGFGYGFTAFYDEDGAARQLDINTIQLSATQRAKITCDETRQ